LLCAIGADLPSHSLSTYRGTHSAAENANHSGHIGAGLTLRVPSTVETVRGALAIRSLPVPVGGKD